MHRNPRKGAVGIIIIVILLIGAAVVVYTLPDDTFNDPNTNPNPEQFYYEDCGYIGSSPCVDDIGPYCIEGNLDYNGEKCVTADYNNNQEYNDPYYDNPNNGNTGSNGYDSGQNTGSNTGAENCGYLNEPCCEGEFTIDEFGMPRVPQWCYDDLECRAEICVEGPGYTSTPRPNY
ncbi:MAG: hypothetical protein ABIJ92_00985 [Candidatus Aenigmatarchaeota archaeon]